VLRVDAGLRLGALELELRLALAEGCLAIVGPSGAGKTTALRLIAGLVRPRWGSVSFDGRAWVDVERGIDIAPEARRCGFVFQDYALFGHLRAWQNVAFPLRGSDRRARAIELLERLGLADRAQARPRELSGGERQRVALARALARDPEVLLLDEPLAALDPRSRTEATRALRETLAAARVPCLLVTHDFASASLLGDELAVLEGGRIIQRGSAAELSAAPATMFVADLTGASVLSGVASPGADGLTRIELDGGGTLFSIDTATGAVNVSVLPWEIALEPSGLEPTGSARNHLDALVETATPVGNRVRVGLRCPQPLTAEVTSGAADALALRPGVRITAAFKATATRLLAR
jgi:molybdate transport system ATP-binding protein